MKRGQKSSFILIAVLCASVAVWWANKPMRTPEIDKRTLENIQNLNEDFKNIVVDVYETCPHPFIVIDGLRTIEEQRTLLEEGKSRTLNSKHLTGRAVDFVISSFDWNDIDSFRGVAQCFKEHEGIEWGGDWRTFKDFGHIQYPS